MVVFPTHRVVFFCRRTEKRRPMAARLRREPQCSAWTDWHARRRQLIIFVSQSSNRHPNSSRQALSRGLARRNASPAQLLLRRPPPRPRRISGSSAHVSPTSDVVARVRQLQQHPPHLVQCSHPLEVIPSAAPGGTHASPVPLLRRRRRHLTLVLMTAVAPLPPIVLHRLHVSLDSTIVVPPLLRAEIAPIRPPRVLAPLHRHPHRLLLVLPPHTHRHPPPPPPPPHSPQPFLHHLRHLLPPTHRRAIAPIGGLSPRRRATLAV